MTIKGVSEVTKSKSDITELFLQLLELNVSVYFCWIVNNNITVLRRTAKQFGGRTVITNNHGLYITCGGSRVRYRMNYCWWKNTFEQLLYKANNWWLLSCDFCLIAYLYNVTTAFLVIVPLPPLGGHGLSPCKIVRGRGGTRDRAHFIKYRRHLPEIVHAGGRFWNWAVRIGWKFAHVIFEQF